jgi:hypothetical protein
MLEGIMVDVPQLGSRTQQVDERQLGQEQKEAELSIHTRKGVELLTEVPVEYALPIFFAPQTDPF